MTIWINKPRKDGKFPIIYGFDSGKRNKSLVPNKEFPTIQSLLDKYHDATVINQSGVSIPNLN